MGPPVFKGKRKKGIFMSKLKPKSYKRKRTSTGRSPHKSPATKGMLLRKGHQHLLKVQVLKFRV